MPSLGEPMEQEKLVVVVVEGEPCLPWAAAFVAAVVASGFLASAVAALLGKPSSRARCRRVAVVVEELLPASGCGPRGWAGCCLTGK